MSWVPHRHPLLYHRKGGGRRGGAGTQHQRERLLLPAPRRHTVVLLAEDGDFPIRSHVLYEGARFPLGVVSSGMAVLAYLPDAAIHAYLERADLQSEWGNGFRIDAVWERVALTRKTGWAVNPGQVVEGSWGMAAAVFDANQNPIGALTLTGIEARFNADRQPVLGQLLLRHAHRLSRTVRR